MGNTFKDYMLLARRWAWMLVLGAIICGSATYLISTFLRPVYQASAYLIVDSGSATQSGMPVHTPPVSTFARLIPTSAVLAPVLSQHAGLSMQDLSAMISVQPQTDAQIIELDVQVGDPRLASELANQISQSFAHYVDTNQTVRATVQIIPAQVPSLPAQPHWLAATGIGGGIGLLLALLLVVFFEWLGNRATSMEQIQELLGTQIMTMVPRLPRYGGEQAAQPVPAEKYHMISASLNVAQASRTFKLVMFTSALAGEGKSTIASNVAMNLARAGKQVLLIDLNLNRPALAQLFHLNNQFGLTNLLAGKSKRLQLEHYCQKTDIDGLEILPSGTQQMKFSDVLQALSATQFFTRLKQTGFDYILFDAPPLFPVAETRMLAASVEALVLVVNGSHTPRRVIEKTQQILRRLQSTRLLGVIVNQSSGRDYMKDQPWTFVPPEPQHEIQSVVEQETMALPTVSTGLLQEPEIMAEEEETRFPDTGEHEQVRVETPEYVIRPFLSLSGLALPTNGLTRRVFQVDTSPDVPSTLQNS